MRIVESLDWILDKNNTQINKKNEYRLNIEFVHSLGLKCDCVGWSKLDLQKPRADEILSSIDSFCRSNGWKARGVYERKYTDYSSDWYEMIPTSFNDNTLCDHDDRCESEDGSKIRVFNIRAYHEIRTSPKERYDSILVPERFRDACIRHGITDVDFCWARDKGKYQAEQYFHMYGNRQIKTIAKVEKTKVDDKEKISDLGGYLPRIAEIFYDLQQINIQECYIESDIPFCTIAYAYFPSTFSRCGRNRFLIHKDFAEILLKEKAICEHDLSPAMVVTEPFGGYTLINTSINNRPTSACLKQSISEYETLKSTERPTRLISDKDALKLLRIAKKEHKEDFGKALPKSKSFEIDQTDYAPLLPYYLIADGGVLSDEYELLSFDKATKENEMFSEELMAEELLETKPDGVVIAKCPNGDRIILRCDGRIIRFSHEEPVSVEEWISLSQFVVDVIDE